MSLAKVAFHCSSTEYPVDDELDSFIGFADHSALLKHELAYVLGQINDTHAIPILSSTLADKKEDPMVRHEVSHFLC